MSRKMFFLILLIGTLAQINANIYLSSLPHLVHDLQTKISLVQLTLSIYFLGFSVSNLIYGPISDYIGRRGPLLFGIGLSFIGIMLCIFSTSIYILITGRLIQGLGLGVCGSVGRSISRDKMEGNDLARFSSYLAVVATIILASSPLLGGYLQYYFNWQASFIFLFLYNSIIWLIIFFKLPETNQSTHLEINHQTVLKNYLSCLSNLSFFSYTLFSCLAYAAFATILTISPFVFQNSLGVTSVMFGWFAYLISISFIISGYLNTLLLTKKGIKRMIQYGAVCMCSSALLLLIISSQSMQNVINISACLIIFTIGAGLILINAFAGATQLFSKMAGTASALFGSLQMLSGALAAWMISFFKLTNISSMAWLLIVFSICLLLSFRNDYDKT